MKKKIVFYETDKRHADLKVRLKYDNLSQQVFFSELISGYIDGNENIVMFIEEVKTNKRLQAKYKMNASKKLNLEGRKKRKNFVLDDEDIEKIYDIIEVEHLNILGEE